MTKKPASKSESIKSDQVLRIQELERQLEIEAALERVRARTMGMLQSHELRDVVSVMYDEMELLGLAEWGCSIMIFHEDSSEIEFWLAEETRSNLTGNYYAKGKEHPVYRKLWDYWKSQGPPMTLHHQDAYKKDFDDYWLSKTDFKQLPDVVKASVYDRNEVFLNYASMRNGLLNAVSHEGFSKELMEVLERFAKVFEQSYTRFLDLKKAEEQAREAQIEAALERVRAASMAMHKSEDLFDVVTLVFDQLSLQGIQMDTSMIIENHEDSKDWVVWAAAGGQNYSDQHRVPYLKHDLYDRLESARRKGLKFLEDSFTKAQKDEWFTQIFTNSTLVAVPSDRKKYIYEKEGLSRSVVLTKNVSFTFFRYSLQSFSSSENELFKRFARVFEQAYSRFLDIQKAEAQAREAQIEVALERVRSTSMAMHDSNDLHKVIISVFNQLVGLGLKVHSTQIVESIHDEKIFHMWNAANGQIYPMLIHFPYNRNIFFTRFRTAIENGESFYTLRLTKRQKDNLFRHYFTKSSHQDVPKSRQDFIFSTPGIGASTALGKHTALTVLRYDGILYSNDENEIIKRFATVFEQTYTRFLDLQKAEAQAKEAQIEAALEKVRSSMMAMHKSDELRKVVGSIFTQLQVLGFESEACALIIYNSDFAAEHWLTGFTHDIYPRSYKIPYVDIPYFTDFLNAWKKGVSFQEFIMEGKPKIAYAKWALEHSELKHLPDEFKKEMVNPDRINFADAFMRYGMIEIMGRERIPEEKVSVLKRFAKVFEQTYTRFLDLQKAEAQAREAQIELALERVRASAMAMRKSDDLIQCTTVVFEELEKLDLTMQRSGIGVFDRETRDCDLWTCAVNSQGEIELATGITSMTIHPMLTTTWDAWLDQTPVSYTLEGQDLINYYNIISEGNFYLSDEVIRNSSALPKEYYYYTPFVAGGLYFFSDTEPLQADKDILGRFAAVFHMTYTRFLDLQKAEEQAREAQVETALERVRARTMAMHNSEDVGNTISLMFEQLDKLDISTIRCGLGICLENYRMEVWTARANSSQKVEKIVGYLDMKIHKLLKGVYDAWKEGKKYSEYDLKGKDLIKYFKALNEAPEYPINFDLASLPTRQFHSNFTFQEGVLYVFTKEPLSLDDQQVFTRFAGVFGQTYRRYLDLQKAEAQAREAQIEAALERVRAASMAMHKSEELADLSFELVKQVQGLGVATWFCAFNIYDDDGKGSLEWGSNAQGTYERYRTPREGVFLRYYEAGQRGEEFLINEIGEDECPAHYEYLCSLPGVGEQLLKMKEAGIPFPTSQIDHVAFFKYGYILFITFEPEPESHDVFKRFAKVFEQTYTRFLDLQKAEVQAAIAKKQSEEIEKAYENLKATQTQLIQAEKMASLGELTAGIAHEIQNPLNFVNNFSDVSGEMIDEAVEELNNNDNEEVKEILTGLKGNLEKISHHGNRASSIVKGMLDHSRAGTGEKVPTDINALCDEYVRLSYHGLRAKDNSFNSAYEMNFDDSKPKIKVIPQELGRVLLNILNNAFYAVSAKALATVNGEYKPKVTITTKRLNDSMTITIKDNGIGMSQETIDKVFQPFFTTKPTGEGTGLGMSISYDIVKAHGGELIVSSKSGGGSTFTIVLPN